MGRLNYNIVNQAGKPRSVTLFAGGRSYAATSEHPSFSAIVKALLDGEDEKKVVALFDTTHTFRRGLRKVKRALVGGPRQDILDRISMTRDGVTFDGTPLHDSLSDTIIRFMREGNDDYKPLVLFLAKVMENDNEHSREHLYRWLANRSFRITEDGDIIAYKGVHQSDKDGVYRSNNRGRAYVNGVEHIGYIPYKPGDVVTMPREEVTFDPHQSCARGLHVGTWGYAKTFADSSLTLLVLVDPRHVVSVPTDANGQKMRVSEFTVVRLMSSQDYEKTDANNVPLLHRALVNAR